MITIALSKGRIFTETLPFLAAAGVVPLEDPETSRKLLIGTNHPGYPNCGGACQRRSDFMSNTALQTWE